MEAAAFVHFSSNPLSFLSLPLQTTANVARSVRGKPNFTDVAKKTLFNNVAIQLGKKCPEALAVACSGLGLKGKAATAEGLAEALWGVWVGRERWAAAVLCLAEAAAAADAAAEAAGKKPLDGGSFREIFRCGLRRRARGGLPRLIPPRVSSLTGSAG